jgi:hypothetical protein
MRFGPAGLSASLLTISVVSIQSLMYGHGLHVITTELPNGRTGWVDAHGALRLSRTTVSLDVDLSSRLLRVRVADRLARTMRVGIGASGTSTPTWPSWNWIASCASSQRRAPAKACSSFAIS